MKQATVREAKTHFSRILAEVEAGDEVVVCRRNQPVARIVPYRGTGRSRPIVGNVTSKPVQLSEGCFVPLNAKELKEWGL